LVEIKKEKRKPQPKERFLWEEMWVEERKPGISPALSMADGG
jgi:hypothetical protein